MARLPHLPAMLFASATVEIVVLRLLIPLLVIVIVARLAAALFRRLGQPGVVGEIMAGLILGPSVLGRLFPGASAWVFAPTLEVGEAHPVSLNWIFTVLSQLGLILLLFLIGLEFDFGHLRWHGRAAFGISVAGMVAPFGLGLALAPLLLPQVPDAVGFDEPARRLGFSLFLGTALSITAIPILGRIMIELNMTRTRLGTVTIAAAAVDDAAGWILLAAIAAIVRSEFNTTTILVMVGSTVGFGLFMTFAARPLLKGWVRAALRRGDGELSVNDLAVLLAVMFVAALATNAIGIFSIFGAFFLGAVLSDEEDFRLAVGRRLRDLVTVLFLPIFFTFTGLRTDVGTLESAQLWLLCGVVSAAAVLGKFGGCGLAAWLCGFPGREAACVGVMMNTRALMALIVINLGYELGVLPRSVFCMLVLMAILTTVMTTPLLLRLMPGTELEPYIRASGFLERRAPRPPQPTEEATRHPGP